MIYIVHGDHTAKSRAQISNQQKKLDIQNKIEINLEDISPSELQTHLNANSLFGESTLILLNITNTRVEDKHIEIFKNKSKDNILIIYSEKTIPKNTVLIKQAENLNAKVIENKKEVEGNVFGFVDKLYTRNRKETYKEYERLVDAEPFYILSMIFYGLRSVTQALLKTPSFEKKQGFTKIKATNQAKEYNIKEIKEIYKVMYDIEKKGKTGLLDINMLIPLAIENVLNSK